MQFVFTLTCRLAFFLKLLVVYVLSKELGCIVQIVGDGAYIQFYCTAAACAHGQLQFITAFHVHS